MLWNFSNLLLLAVNGWNLRGFILDEPSNVTNADDSGRPTNVWMEPSETTIKVHWTPPRDVDNLRLCVIQYRIKYEQTTVKIPVIKTLQWYLLSGLEENTAYEIRMYCLYGDTVTSPTDWIGMSTRTVSRKPSICSASLPHATLEAGCLEYARNTICEYTCDEGYRMSDIADVRYGHRREEGIQEKYVYCLLGTWATYSNNDGIGFIDICLPESDVRYGHRKEEGIQEKYVYCLLGTWATYSNNDGLGFIDICLPESDFQKCPESIPNGSLEPHCGPATDWLCHFTCNEGYSKHGYMHGNLKWFSDPEYSLYCDEGTWKTGYESLGVDIASVCVSKERSCMEDVPNMEVYTPCPSGHSCGFDCNKGFRRHGLADGYLVCENGEWILEATKIDSSLTPENVCIAEDIISICPRNISNGYVNGECNVRCNITCDEGYLKPDWSRVLTCEGGKWVTENFPYDDTNICFPKDGHLCPEDIPNGYENPRHGTNRDYENGRGYTHAACDEGFRNHRTMIMECVGGTWLTGQEHFGLDTSFMCLPETDENTWFIPDYFKEEYGN